MYENKKGCMTNSKKSSFPFMYFIFFMFSCEKPLSFYLNGLRHSPCSLSDHATH